MFYYIFLSFQIDQWIDWSIQSNNANNNNNNSPLLAQLESYLKENNQPTYLLNNSFTLADIFVYSTLRSTGSSSSPLVTKYLQQLEEKQPVLKNTPSPNNNTNPTSISLEQRQLNILSTLSSLNQRVSQLETIQTASSTFYPEYKKEYLQRIVRDFSVDHSTALQLWNKFVGPLLTQRAKASTARSNNDNNNNNNNNNSYKSEYISRMKRDFAMGEKEAEGMWNKFVPSNKQ